MKVSKKINKKKARAVMFKDGSIYQGEFKNGIVHGKGVLKFKNGSIYEGEFEDGFMHGKGKKTYPDGFYYEGDFHKDFMHGSGKLSAPKNYVNYRKTRRNFLEYEGDFAADTRSGRGRIKYSDGSNYSGEVLHGYMHGRGVLENEGMKYQGNFKEDRFEGLGKFESKDTNPYKYEGSFKNGLKDGRGKLHLGEGKLLSTTWTAGEKEGRFTLETPDSVSEGVFEKDEVVGDITTRFSNGDLYVGNCINFYRQGKGRMVWSDHKKLKTYEGDFKENMMHGRGVLVFKNGMVYNGKFIKNRMQGFGKLETAAYTAEGEFFNGKPSGTFIVNFRTGAQYLGKFDGYKRNGFGRIKYTFIEEQRRDLNQSEVSIAGRAIPGEDEEIEETKVQKVYEGWWVNGKKHGKGVLTIGKVVYDGEWRDGKKDGWFDVIRRLGRFKKEKIRALYENGRVVKEAGRKEEPAD